MENSQLNCYQSSNPNNRANWHYVSLWCEGSWAFRVLHQRRGIFFSDICDLSIGMTMDYHGTIFPNWERWLFCFGALLLHFWFSVNFSLLTILMRHFLHIRFSLRPAALSQSLGTYCPVRWLWVHSLVSPAGPSGFGNWWFALKGLQCLKGTFHQCLPSQRLVALYLVKVCYVLERVLWFLQL